MIPAGSSYVLIMPIPLPTRSLSAAALCLGLAATACVETPRVKLHHADFQGASLAGAVLDVVLEIHNPNSYDIQLRDLTAETTFANKYTLPPIVLHPDQWLPAGQSTQVHVPKYTVRGSANVTATRTFGVEADNYPIELTGTMPRQIMVNLGTGQISF
jgi:hypothetical protein